MKFELNIKISITKITDMLLNQIIRLLLDVIKFNIQYLNEYNSTNQKIDSIILILPENINKRTSIKRNSICN